MPGGHGGDQFGVAAVWVRRRRVLTLGGKQVHIEDYRIGQRNRFMINFRPGQLGPDRPAWCAPARRR